MGKFSFSFIFFFPFFLLLCFIIYMCMYYKFVWVELSMYINYSIFEVMYINDELYWLSRILLRISYYYFYIVTQNNLKQCNMYFIWSIIRISKSKSYNHSYVYSILHCYSSVCKGYYKCYIFFIFERVHIQFLYY